MIKKHLLKLLGTIRLAVTSTRGREVGLFVLFLAISFVFWLMLSLNNEAQQEVDIPLAVVNVPDSVTFITLPPHTVKVSVRDKGTSLLRYAISTPSTLKINWADYASRNGDNRFLMTRQDIAARLRDYFGPSSQIVSVNPDSIRIIYTDSPGRKVAVNLIADVRAALGHIVNGNLTIEPDSVTLYSVTDLPHSLDTVQTLPIVRGRLTDTTSVHVKINPIAGVRIIPDVVRVTIPVEPLIARTQVAQIIVRNLPQGYGLLTFPSRVELSYLIPMSLYNQPPQEVKAYVDFTQALASPTSKVAVTLSLIPDTYRNISFTPDSVEYIVEERTH